MHELKRPSALDVSEIGALISKLSDKWLAETQSHGAMLPMPQYRAIAAREGQVDNLPRIVTNAEAPSAKRRPFYISLMAALRRAAVPAHAAGEPYLARLSLATRGTLGGEASLPALQRSREASVRPPLPEPLTLRLRSDRPLAQTEAPVQAPCGAVQGAHSAPAPNLCTGLRGDRLPRAVEPARRTTEAATNLFRTALECTLPADPAPGAGSTWRNRNSLLTAPRAANGDHHPPRQPSLAGLVDKATAESLAPLLRQWVSDAVSEAVNQAVPRRLPAALNRHPYAMSRTDVLR